jgi:hypothetical protein
MNPLSPNQILRNLENGYFMTHREQEEAAQYIRQLQQAVLDEREACAKLLDDFSKTQMVPVKDTWRMGVMAAANAVRDKK